MNIYVNGGPVEEKVIYFSLNTRPGYSYGMSISLGADTRVSWTMVNREQSHIIPAGVTLLWYI